jgi:alpha-1,4-digalacturonate transport system permease protein
MNRGRLITRYIAFLFFTFIFLFPVVWVLLSSFKTQTELFTYPLTFLPEQPTLENYARAFRSGNFGLYFKNSAFVAVVSTAITILINTMAGYALSKYIFRGRDVIFFIMIATLMIPLQVIMIPIFLLEKNLGLLNTLWGIIIPPAATPTGVFLTRQYMMTLPNSLIESARIDGGGEWFIFARIILPLAKPIVATLAIFSFMWRWNDFLWPFIVISRQKKYTIQLALSNFVGQYDVDWSSLLSMTVIAIIPMVLVFLFFQKYFIKGLTAGGVKG